MTKRYLDGDVKILLNLLHKYHKVIDAQTGKIDQTDWKVCKCSWTPEVLKAYDNFLIEEKRELKMQIKLLYMNSF